MGFANAVPLIMLSITEINTLHTDFERIFLLYIILFIEIMIKKITPRDTCG